MGRMKRKKQDEKRDLRALFVDPQEDAFTTIPDWAREIFEKRPRQYAAEIMAEPNRDKRRRMLAEVPDRYRDLVETHVRNGFALRSCNT